MLISGAHAAPPHRSAPRHRRGPTASPRWHHLGAPSCVCLGLPWSAARKTCLLAPSRKRGTKPILGKVQTATRRCNERLYRERAAALSARSDVHLRALAKRMRLPSTLAALLTCYALRHAGSYLCPGVRPMQKKGSLIRRMPCAQRACKSESRQPCCFIFWVGLSISKFPVFRDTRFRNLRHLLSTLGRAGRLLSG